MKSERLFNIWVSEIGNEIEVCIVYPPRALCERVKAADLVNSIAKISNVFTMERDVVAADYEYVTLVDSDALLEFLNYLSDKLNSVHMDLLNKIKDESEAWKQYRDDIMEMQKLVDQLKGVLRHIKHLECKLGLRACRK